MKNILLPLVHLSLAGLFLVACAGPQKSTPGIKNNDVPKIPAMDAKAASVDTTATMDTIGVDMEPIADTVSSIFIKSNDVSRAHKYVDEGTREGVWETYYSNGKVAAKANYVDGILEGIFEVFYPNGNPKEKLAYIHGLREGVSEAYYENGKIKSKGSCKHNKLYGNWETYFENGKLESHVVFDEGFPNGLYEEFYPNGQLKLQGNYVQGKRVGAWNEYHENGKLKKKMSYRD